LTCDLFESLFADAAVVAATDGRAWLQALLDVEAALAWAGADNGLVPPEAARDIAGCAQADRFDVADLGRRAVASASPVVPMLADLRAMLPAATADYLHLGATSQDIMDSGQMLVARRALAPILTDLAACADRLAELADAHRATVQIGRTLLQQAAPTSFGAVAAGWLAGVDQARSGLLRVRAERLAVQYGGPVGTLAALGDAGPKVLAALAGRLELAEPALPWHTDRTRVADLAGALGTAAGALGTIAVDVALLAQTEIGELAEGIGGGSSALPHKRNPARSVLVTACVHRAPGLVGTLLAGAPQELQRAAGRWQAEWPTLTDLLRVVGGAAAHARELLSGLRVYPDRMRANLTLTGGVVMAESLSHALRPALGRSRAEAVIGDACARAVREARPLREVLQAVPEISAALSVGQLAAALDPAGWLGAADAFVTRALAAHATAATGPASGGSASGGSASGGAGP
jgi:3-carboxy-cis,cis-muconate cycloisomerase